MGHEPEPGPDPTPEPHTLLSLSFNQDSTCFAAGTSAGFRVYECDPAFRQTMRRDFPPRGALGFVHMLYRYSVFALVGSGPDSLYPTNQVQFWEDDKSCVNHHLPLRAEVRGIRLRRDRVVVVALRHKICVFDFNSRRPVLEIETAENPKGLCDVSQSRGPAVLACPGLHKGRVRVENFGSKRTEFITAHESSLACLALTHDGRFLATASEKGTLVRVFNTSDGAMLQEVRRGTERAEIYCLAFSSTAQWLAVSSDKGTVHVFSVKVETYLPNSSGISSLSFFKVVLPKYFSSEWSVAKFHVPEGLQHIVAFGQKNNTIMILGMDGSFYRCQFDPVKGGQMTQLEHHTFMKAEELTS